MRHEMSLRGGIFNDAVDLFDTKLMDCLMPRPGEVVKKFEELYAKSPQEATDYFYKLSQDSNYIRRYRIAKDIRWSVPSAYGDIDISINLSKPEKDPKAIAAAKLAKQSGYPGAPEPPHHSADDQSDGVGIPVLAICVLQ